MSVAVQIICSGSAPCFALITENSRILINAPEGTQRLCIESRIKLGKIRAIMLSDHNSAAVGGLPGLCLTLADAGATSVAVCGTQFVSNLMQTTRAFMNVPKNVFSVMSSFDATLDDVQIQQINFGNKSCFLVETSEVKGKFDIAKAEMLKIPKGPLYGHLKNGLKVTLEDGRVIHPEEVVGPSESSRFFLFVCCIVESESDILSNFFSCPQLKRFQRDSELADRLDFIFHQSAASVVQSSEYNAWMHSFADSVHHVTVGSGLCVEQCAFTTSVRYCNSLKSVCPDLFPRLSLQPQQSDVPRGGGISFDGLQATRGAPNMRFTILPSNKKGIIDGQTDFPALLDEEGKIFQNELENNADFQSKYSIANTAKSLNGYIENSMATSGASSNCENVSILSHSTNALYFLGTGCAVPCKYRNVSGIVLHFPASSSMMLVDCGEGTWEQLERLMADTPSLLDSFRIHSSDRSVIEDSLWRRRLLAEQIKLVWISHPHADHHLGLVRVITERMTCLRQYEKIPKPLVVIAPPSVLKFLREYCDRIEEDFASMFVAVSSRQFDPSDACSTSDCFWASLSPSMQSANYCLESVTAHEGERYGRKVMDRSARGVRTQRNPTPISDLDTTAAAAVLSAAWDTLYSIGIKSLVNIPVMHCSQSYGLILEGKSFCSPVAEVDSFFKLVYSGDTRPCDALIEAGRGATILIHEATFEDTLQSEAEQKRHCTVSEALEVGSKMGACRVILTHFSQRYPGIPPLESSESNHMLKRTIFAFDFMILSFPSLLWAPLYMPALAAAFPFHGSDDTEIADEIIVKDTVPKKKKQKIISS